MKRGMDVIGSLLALVLFSPLFLLVTIAIKLTSKGQCSFARSESDSMGNLLFS